MDLFYILDEHNDPVPVETRLDYLDWLDKRIAQLKRTGSGIHVGPTGFTLAEATIRDGIVVSTCFFGIDLALIANHPILFETMVFGGKRDKYQERYSTWNEAMAGHARILATELADL